MPENLFVHAMDLGKLETEVLKKLWIQVTEDSDGYSPDAVFVKYSRYRVRQKINLVYNRIATMTRAIRSWFIIPTKTGYTQYPLPLNVLGVFEPVYYYTSSTAYDELPVYDRKTIDDLEPGWRTQTGVPNKAYVGDWTRQGRKLGLTPTPTADATGITLAATVLERAQPFGPAEALYGSAAPASATNTYVDSDGQNFVKLGVVPGMVILNLTDLSRGTITSIATTGSTSDTIVCSANLSGGSLNVWTPGDEMRIIGGEYGGFFEIGDTEATYLISPTAGALPNPGVTMAAGNVLVECYIMPALLREQTQMPELHPVLHQAIAIGAAAELAEEEPMSSPEFQQSQKYWDRFNKEIAGASTWLAEHYFSGDYQLWGKRR